jgi:Tfp pilus assembly protein PilN
MSVPADSLILSEYETEEDVTVRHSSQVILWLVVFSVAGLILPLVLISTAIEQNNKTAALDLAQIEEEVNNAKQPEPAEQALRDTLLETKNQRTVLETLRDDLVSQHVNWSAVMAVVGNYGSAKMTLTGLSQSGTQITLSGQAETESTVIAYARMLEETGLFTRVVVQSISLKVLPTSTPTPGVATPTAVPDVAPGPDQVVEFVILVELRPQEAAHE